MYCWNKKQFQNIGMKLQGLPGGSRRAEAEQASQSNLERWPKACQKGATALQGVTKKMPKRSWNSLANLTFGGPVFQVEFQRVFFRIWKPAVPELLPTFSEKLQMFRDKLENEKVRFDCAGASGSRAEAQRNKRNRRKHDLRTNTPMMPMFCDTC